MQSGRPSESSSRHRWGKYNSGIGSPKVASGPLLSEVFGLLPLEIWICPIFFMHEWEAGQAGFYFPAPRPRTSEKVDLKENIRSKYLEHPSASASLSPAGLYVCA